MVLNKLNISKKWLLVITIAIALIAIAVIVTLVIVLKSDKALTIYKGAVVTNGKECAEVARNIMAKGGNIADAAISALFCEGIVQPESMGLGGGFLMTIYNKSTGEVISLNAREVAPKDATQNMFEGNPTLSSKGGLAVAVLGELMGYWELYKKYGGGIPWKELVQPSIDLCKMGIKVTKYAASVLSRNKATILEDPLLSEIFINQQTNDVFTEGDVYTRLRLSKTLEIIAEEGGATLHNGSLTAGLVKDIQNHQGIIRVEDLNDYKPKWQTPISYTLSSKLTIHTAPLPGSGIVLTLILNILDSFLDLGHSESLDNYQKIMENFKFAFAKRTLLGDPDFVNISELVRNLTSREYAINLRSFINLTSTQNNISYYGANTAVPEDHGTANLCFFGPNGDAIAVTSTINGVFGAGFVSESTGIILNNQMDDFSSDNIINLYHLPPSPANYIKPGKRPLSSMSPTIIVNKDGDVEMLVGAAGGSKIITTIAQIIIRHLWYGTDLEESSDTKRFHHQLEPMEVVLEKEFKTEDVYIVEGLTKIGHNISFLNEHGFAAATCISKRNGESLSAAYDKRRSGSVSYL